MTKMTIGKKIHNEVILLIGGRLFAIFLTPAFVTSSSNLLKRSNLKRRLIDCEPTFVLQLTFRSDPRTFELLQRPRTPTQPGTV